jgi:integrase
MAGTRKTPKLRIYREKYFCTDVYLPNGNRTTVGFGTTDDHTEGEIYAAFGKWLDLFNQQPQKVLSFKNPYEAIKQIINPRLAITIGELLDKYLAYAKKTTKPTKTNKEHPDLHFANRAKKFLEPYHSWPVSDFGPDELLDVQKALVNYEFPRGKKKKRYTRGGVNDVIKWIRRIWSWGMGRKLVAAEHIQGLEEVKPLRMGDTDAPDNHKRARVKEEEFVKVVNTVNSVVGDMLKLIWYTAMRPSEVCEMRPYDIIRDDPECWLYIPGRDQTPVGRHKTTRYERVKVIPLTAESQKILNAHIKDFNSKEYIFSPKQAMQEFLAKRSANRKTPLSCGNRPGINPKEHPMVKPSDKYDHQALRIACKRGCVRAGVTVFVPYDLRRTIATRTRSSLGKEAAKVLLGHTKTDTTDIYLLEEVQEAVKVAKLLATKT